MWEQLLTIAYGFFGFIGVAAWLPQIKSLLMDKTRSKNVSLATYGLWFMQVNVCLLYGLIVLEDRVMVYLYAGSIMLTGTAFLLLLRNRYIRPFKHSKLRIARP